MIKKSPLFFSVMLFASIFSACDDENDEKVISPRMVQFEQDELSFLESDGENTITILFDNPAVESGVLTLNIVSEHADKFSFTPAAEDGKLVLVVSKGDESASFTIEPTDNVQMDGDKNIAFTISSVTEGFGIGTRKQFQATCLDDESPATVNFTMNLGSGRENNNAGGLAVLGLTHLAPGEGLVTVSFTSANSIYGVHFTTEPAAVDGKISLAVVSGADHLQFKILPIENTTFSGDRKILYTIDAAQGAVRKGQGLNLEYTIIDDELAGVRKSYHVTAGNWSYGRSYAYNEEGYVSEVAWSKNTPGHSEGKETYTYLENGQLDFITETTGVEKYFTWSNGRIVKSERYVSGVLQQYTNYGYDEAGNVGETSDYYLQPNGEFLTGFLMVFLYKPDGNLHKKLVYSPVEGPEEFILVSTETYDHFLENENPFPMLEILPNVSAQPNLPTQYSIQHEGENMITYNLSYEFSDDGKPTKRTATSSLSSEVAVYEYY